MLSSFAESLRHTCGIERIPFHSKHHNLLEPSNIQKLTSHKKLRLKVGPSKSFFFTKHRYIIIAASVVLGIYLARKILGSQRPKDSNPDPHTGAGIQTVNGSATRIDRTQPRTQKQLSRAHSAYTQIRLSNAHATNTPLGLTVLNIIIKQVQHL